MFEIFPQTMYAILIVAAIIVGFSLCTIVVCWMASRANVTDHYEDDYPKFLKEEKDVED